MRVHPISILRGFLFLLPGVMASGVWADPVVFQVTVDTSSLGTPPQYGYIDLQFNPSILPDQQSATATVSNFMTDGVLNSNPADPNNGAQGDVAGSLGPAVSVVFRNDNSVNEYTEDLTFGKKITFDLTLDGSMIEKPNGQGGGTTFYLDFLDPNGNYLLTNDPSGSTANGFFTGYVTVNPDGTTSVTTNPGANNSASDVTFVPITSPPGTAPEPSAGLLLGAGLLGLAAFVRRRYSVPVGSQAQKSS